MTHFNQKIFAEVKSALLASELKNSFEVTGGGFRIVKDGRVVYVAFPHKSFGALYPDIAYESGPGSSTLLHCSSADDVIRQVLEIL